MKPSLRPRPTVAFLVGFMGAGKTSVGRALGQLLNGKFEDLDDRIEAQEGRSIEQIFRESGEAEFRRAESAALSELLAERNSFLRVVALGGGAFAQAQNALLVQEAGAVTVFLDAPAEELYRRCAQEGRERPLCRDFEQFRKLLDERRPSYLKATLQVDTSGKAINVIAAEVACSLGLR